MSITFLPLALKVSEVQVRILQLAASHKERNKLSCPLLGNRVLTERKRETREVCSISVRPERFHCVEGQLQRTNSVSLCLLSCLFSISDYDVTLTFGEKSTVLHGSDKLLPKKHFLDTSSTSYQEDKTTIVSFNSGLRKETLMTKTISKYH